MMSSNASVDEFYESRLLARGHIGDFAAGDLGILFQELPAGVQRISAAAFPANLSRASL